jgi:Zn-dependent protease
MTFINFNLIDILLSLPAVFLAISFHEFAHAYVAYRMGDPTPKMQGRLTLDPIAHIDWIGLIMFTVFGFGWAKPVQVNHSNFRNRRRGDILVSLAGPIANLFLAFITFIVLLAIEIILPETSLGRFINQSGIVYQIFDKIVWLNIVFSLLNLVPIPPFDGYHILKTIFFRRNANLFWQLERYSILILFAFIMLNLFNYIVGIPAKYIYLWLQKLAFIIWMLL